MTDLSELRAASILENDVPLGPLTTYRAGGPASYLATVRSVEEVEMVVQSGILADMPVLVLGRGSNLVVADSGFEGVVIKPEGSFMSIEVDGVEVTAGAAAPLPRVARASVDAGLTGLEFLVGVPGSVGGAVRQNAGCFGQEIVDVLVTADILDLSTGDRYVVTPDQLDLQYRHSNVSEHQMVLSARLRGSEGDTTAGKERMREITRWRKEHQPGGTLNAGSVFKNPPGEAAGELIDRLGLKGTSVGGASVSDKHANFIVATPQATAADVFELVRVVKDAVMERSGTNLEPEIQFIGFTE